MKAWSLWLEFYSLDLYNIFILLNGCLYFPKKLIYNVFGFWWFPDGIHVMFFWRIIVVILWQIKISIGVVLSIVFMLFTLFLLILLIIWIHVFIHVIQCSIIVVLRVLMFDTILSWSPVSSYTPVISGSLYTPEIVLSSSPTGFHFRS